MSEAQTKKQPAKSTRSTVAQGVIGRSKDGIEIARPVVRPRSFTVRELRRVMRDVRREEAIGGAG